MKIPCKIKAYLQFLFVRFCFDQTLYKLEKTEYNCLKLYYTGGKNGIIR